MKVRLNQLGEIITGNTPSKKNTEFWNSKDICFIKPDVIFDNGVINISSSNEYISNAARKKARIVGENAVLVTCIGSIGKIGVVAKGEYAFNQQINAIIPNEKIMPKYLAYNLLFNKPRLIEMANAAVVPIINKSQFGEFLINIESNKEKQAEVVKILDKLAYIIQKREEGFRVLDELTNARFVEIFGDPVQNPKRYPIHQLSEYITSLTSGSRGWAKYCVDDGKEWFITIKNVKECSITTDNMQPVNAPDNAEAKRTKVREGDLLISITADLGRTGVVTKEIAEHGAYINQHLSCIRIDRKVLNPLYVSHYMESPAGKEQFNAKNQSAVKAGLNFNSINSLKLMVPPMEEQMIFIEFIKQVNKSKVIYLTLLNKLTIFTKSLL